MTTEAVLRTLAAFASLVAGQRKGRVWLLLAGVCAAFAIFGVSPQPFPSPTVAALLALALLVLYLAICVPVWSPILGEAAAGGALLAVPAAVFALATHRDAPFLQAASFSAVTLAAVSLFAAEGSRANAESGWRRPALWAGAAVVPPALLAGFAAWLTAVPGRGGLLLAVALLASVLVWLPALWAERSRVKTELAEEVLLGLLPEEDAVALRFPWTRSLEKRFGRSDERREYVRSALLLAVARQQQRRRSGEAVRLRQLEVLTFRTRIRRTLDARATRMSQVESGEFSSG
jgi:hypothetical protein